MGRVKQYSKRVSRKKRIHSKKSGKKDEDSGSDMELEKEEVKHSEEALSVGKQKQNFKKHKAKDVKQKIQELKLASKKLKKKNLSQKAEKKKIAKEIHRLKASIKESKDIEGGEEKVAEAEKMD